MWLSASAGYRANASRAGRRSTATRLPKAAGWRSIWARRPMPSQRAVRATSIRGDGRRKSVVTTKQSRQPPLNDDAPGLVALRLIGAVGGIEADHRPFTAEIFERRILPVDQRDDDIALARRSAERRVGKEGVSTGRSWWAPSP